MKKITTFVKILLGIPVTRYFLSIDGKSEEVFINEVPNNVKKDNTFYNVDTVIHEFVTNKIVFVWIFLIKH